MNRNIKKYQGGGLLAGPIQSREYVPLPYAQAFEIQRLNEADRAVKEKDILDMYKGFYDIAMQAPPNMQEESMAELQPYLNRIEQGLAEVGGDPLKYRGGMDVMKSFYSDMASGKLGSLQRAGSQYNDAIAEQDKLNELFMKGKGGVSKETSKLALTVALNNMEQQQKEGRPVTFKMPNLVPETDVLKKVRNYLNDLKATKWTDANGNTISQLSLDDLYTLADDFIRTDSGTSSTIAQEIDLNMQAGNFPVPADMSEIYKEQKDKKTGKPIRNKYAELYKELVSTAPLSMSPEDIENLAHKEVYRQALIDQKINDFSRVGALPFQVSETTLKEKDTKTSDPADQLFYSIGDSAVETIDKSDAERIGLKILDLDDQIKQKQAQIDAAAGDENLIGTHQLEVDRLTYERNNLLVQAGNKSEEMINAKAKNSVLWNDNVFNESLNSYYENVKGASKINEKLFKEKNITLEDFTEKAKILSAIPGLTSIPLLTSSPDDIAKIEGLTSSNYSLLAEQFEEGESVMPYLQAAQWIQRKAKRADVINTYEKSLRIPHGMPESYIADATAALTEMIHKGNLAYTDFYANEDVTATIANFDRPIESISLEPSLSMINGAPAYKLNFYDYNKVKGTEKVERGGIEKTEFVRGTNQSDELNRYEGLGVNLINLSKTDMNEQGIPRTPAGKAYLRDGIQVVANARVLSPLQSTLIETADVGEKMDINGNPYVEREIPGYNIKIRRVDHPGNVSIYELRNINGKPVPYFPDGFDKAPQAIKSGSLEEIALQYFMHSKESIDATGTLGRDVINMYLQD